MLSVGYILGDCLEPEADITWSPFDVSHEVVNESRKDRVSNQPSDKRNATKKSKDSGENQNENQSQVSAINRDIKH